MPTSRTLSRKRLASVCIALVVLASVPAAFGTGPSGPAVTSPAVLARRLDSLPPTSSVAREKILRELAVRGPAAGDAVPALRRALETRDAKLRILAGRALWRISGDSVPLLSACRSALATGDSTAVAVTNLGDLGPRAASAAADVRALLESNDAALRIQAAEALAKITPTDDEPARSLAGELERVTGRERVQAVYAAGAVTGAPRQFVVGPLTRAAEDADEQVRVAATIVLAEMELDGPLPAPAPAALTHSESVGESLAPIVLGPVVPAPSRPVDAVANLDDVDVPVPTAPEDPADVAPVPMVDPMEEPGLVEDTPGPVPAYRPAPLASVRAQITIEDDELREFARERFEESLGYEVAAEQGCYIHAMGTCRPWILSSCYWDASGLFHHPLYFENPNSERLGQSYGKFSQPLVETARFYGSVAILPYMLGAMPPGECQYVLGHVRPGDCVPCINQGTIRHGFHDRCETKATIRGAVYQTAAVVGLIFIVP